MSDSPTPAPAPIPKPRKPLWPWFAAVLSGVLLGLAYPPFDQTWLIWGALVPLICALWFGAWPIPRGPFKVRTLEEAQAAERPENQPRLGPGRAFLLGYVTGLGYFGITLFWLHKVHVAALFALPPYLALYPAVWALFFNAFCQPRATWGRRFAKRAQPWDSVERPVWLSSTHNLWLALLPSLAWVGLEWVRGTALTGFGWNGLGVATHDNPALTQAAGLVGVSGLAFPIVFANVTAVATVNRFRHEVGRVRIRPHLDFSVCMALIVVWFSYGAQVLFKQPKPAEGRRLKVALVQPNIPQDRKWNPEFVEYIFNQYRPLTQAAAALQPDLLIWPEAAMPGGLSTHRASREFWSEMSDLGDFNFLVGTIWDEWPDPDVNPNPDAPGKSYNSALLTRRTSESYQLYHKIHLVPFGEILPLRKQLPPLAWLLRDLLPADFDAGKDHTLLRTRSPDVALAPLICFEDTVPDLARHFIAGGGELFVNLTNDGWFGKSSATRQHLINSLFRCVENRRPMVRCANTGVSAYIDEFGRVQDVVADHQGNTFVAQMRILTVNLPPAAQAPVVTPYTRYGELPAILCLAATGVYVGVVLILKKMRRV
jgi:apolipoprotein N-acyltransferase